MKDKLERADRKIAELEATIKDYAERLEFLRKEIQARQGRVSALEQMYHEAVYALKRTYDIDYHMMKCDACVGDACAEAVKMQETFEQVRDEILILAGEIE